MAAAGWGAEGSPAAERQRTFKLRYGAEVTGLAPGAQLRVWFPVPQTTAHQQVTELGRQLPAPGAVGKDRKYGNKMVYFSLAVPTSGRVAFSTHYRVRRHEVRGLLQAGAKVKLSAQQKEVFLAANRRVPVQGEKVEALRFSRATVPVPATRWYPFKYAAFIPGAISSWYIVPNAHYLPSPARS